jgi:thiol:disulfide interchange protein
MTSGLHCRRLHRRPDPEPDALRVPGAVAEAAEPDAAPAHGQAAHLPHASLRTHGGVFAAGVVLCFVLLAGLLIGLRAGGEQLGWGFQLQTPWVVAALTLLFFLIGLNLLGAFEFSFGGALASGAAQRLQGDRLSGSFATGVLAVVVAAPCTAPFMGAALGYAATQPAPIALAVFAVLGAGMAAPYLP